MLQLSASQLVIYFVIYSFIGWLCETVYCSVGNKKWVNRGFLNGPYCPIYGFGGLIIMTLAAPFSQWPPLVAAITMLACGVLEYFTGWLLETAFQTRWWDYSNRRFNLKGRVCLLNLILFGGMGLALVYWIHPWLSSLLEVFSPDAQRAIAAGLLVLLAADFAWTLATITHLRDRLHRLQSVLATLGQYEEAHAWYDKSDIPGSLNRLRAICSADTGNRSAADILAQIDKLTGEKGKGRRLTRAFPNARFKGLEEAMDNLRAQWNAAKSRRKKR